MAQIIFSILANIWNGGEGYVVGREDVGAWG